MHVVVADGMDRRRASAPAVVSDARMGHVLDRVMRSAAVPDRGRSAVRDAAVMGNMVMAAHSAAAAAATNGKTVTCHISRVGRG
jgi:hypothetical protein